MAPPAAFDNATPAGAASTVGDDKTATPSPPYDATDPGPSSPPSPPYWRREPTRAELEAERTRLIPEWVAAHDQFSADIAVIVKDFMAELHVVEADFRDFRRHQQELAAATALSAEGGSSLWRRLRRKVRYGCERFKTRFSDEYLAEEERRAERRKEVQGRFAARLGVAMDELERRKVEVQNKLPWQVESFRGCPPVP